MKVIVRADAAVETGTGHVMRCLSLADALRAQGASISFACRELPPPLARDIEARGHAVAPRVEADDEAADAAQILRMGVGADWIVVDHYGLGAAWEHTVRASGARVLAIDDLARAHDCDVLLDQNFHRRPDLRYTNAVAPSCALLLGPRYALLRAEFAHRRATLQPRDGEVRRLLVSLGGTDPHNATETVLRALSLVDAPGLDTDVVIGASHPALDRLRALVATLPRARCHVQTSEMAALLAIADLAIGAGGSTTWERCALGVPTLAVCLAENQRDLLDEGAAHGFVYVPDQTDQNDPVRLATHVRALLANRSLRHLLSRTGLQLVDGLGAVRVAAFMAAPAIVMRAASLDDGDRLHAWRNDPVVRSMSRNADEIALADHRRWLESVLVSPSRPLLIGEQGGEPVGVVRFDLCADEAEVSIYLVPSRRGRGEGAPLLRAAEAWLRRERPHVKRLRAQVNAGNAASHRLFEVCGYTEETTQYVKRA